MNAICDNCGTTDAKQWFGSQSLSASGVVSEHVLCPKCAVALAQEKSRKGIPVVPFRFSVEGVPDDAEDGIVSRRREDGRCLYCGAR